MMSCHSEDKVILIGVTPKGASCHVSNDGSSSGKRNQETEFSALKGIAV